MYTCRTTNVRAAADYGTAYFRRRADARVTPDDRILDPRALLDVTTAAQNGVDNPGAGLNRAFITNHRQIVDLGKRGRVKLSATILNVNSRNTVGQQILMRL